MNTAMLKEAQTNSKLINGKREWENNLYITSDVNLHVRLVHLISAIFWRVCFQIFSLLLDNYGSQWNNSVLWKTFFQLLPAKNFLTFE